MWLQRDTFTTNTCNPASPMNVQRTICAGTPGQFHFFLMWTFKQLSTWHYRTIGFPRSKRTTGMTQVHNSGRHFVPYIQGITTTVLVTPSNDNLGVKPWRWDPVMLLPSIHQGIPRSGPLQMSLQQTHHQWHKVEPHPASKTSSMTQNNKK